MGLQLVHRLRETDAESQLDSQFSLNRWRSSLGRYVSQLLCGLHGHLIVMHFEPHRLSLHCVWCGYQSHGWDIGQVPERRVERRRMHGADGTALMARPVPRRIA
jgi:hypothetical protein